MATTATSEALIRMQRPGTRLLDAVTLTLTERHGRLVADFYHADDQPTGETTHPSEKAPAGVVEHYEERGWRIADAGVLVAERDRWRAAFEALHARVHRDFNFDAGESAPPEGETALRMMDDLVTFADECHPEIEDVTR